MLGKNEKLKRMELKATIVGSKVALELFKETLQEKFESDNKKRDDIWIESNFQESEKDIFQSIKKKEVEEE